MPRGVVSLADLLHVLARAAPHEADAAARAVGYVRRSAQRSSAGMAPSAPPVVPLAAEPADELDAAAAPPPRSVPAAPQLWRVAAERSAPPLPGAVWAPPGWLADHRAVALPAVLADPQQRPSATAPLVPAPRLAALLRRTLAREQPLNQPDIPQLVHWLALARPLARLPALRRPRWPARVSVVLDAGRALRPLQDDLVPVLIQLQRTLGARVRVLVSDGDPIRLRGTDGRPVTTPVHEARAVVVLGDAGLYASSSAVQQRWIDFARQLQRTGVRPLLLAPLPRRRLAAATLAAFDVALLDDAPRLRLLARTAPAAPAAHTTAAEPGLAVLRAALFGNACVHPPLLRQLRRTLQAAGQPVDLGTEVAVWHDAAVSATLSACTLHPEQRDDVEADWLTLDAALRERLAQLHWRDLQARSPLLRAEYALWLSERLAPGGAMAHTLAQGALAGEHLMRDLVALQRRPDEPAGAAVAAYMARFAQRNPELLADGSDALQAAWALAHAHLPIGSTAWPAGLRSEALRWLDATVAEDDIALALCFEDQPAPRPGDAPLMQLRMAPAEGAATRGWALPMRGGAHWTLTVLSDGRTRLFDTLRSLRLLLGADEHGLGFTLLQLLLHGVTGVKQPGFVALVDILRRIGLDTGHLERQRLELHAWCAHWRPEFPDLPVSDDGLVRWLRGLFPPASRKRLRRAVDSGRGRPLRLRVGDAVVLDPGRRYRVEAGLHSIDIEAAAAPAWAATVERQAEALTVRLHDGRQLLWQPRTHVVLADADGNPTGAAFDLPHGCWWDAAEHAELFGRAGPLVLRCPAWAHEHGVDEHGCWATLEMNAAGGERRAAPTKKKSAGPTTPAQRGFQVRLRFLPPGSFWMNGPAGGNGDRSRAHGPLRHVTLTRGFWCAESPCSQRLWSLVTGSLTGSLPGQGGNDLPATHISAKQLSSRFMRALRRHLAVPLPAYGLPTQAQWEYAAYAGENVLNIDRAPEAQAHAQTTAAAAGSGTNVWGVRFLPFPFQELCADAYAPVKGEDVVDPVASLAAIPALQAVRGLAEPRTTGALPGVVRGAMDPARRNAQTGWRLVIDLARTSLAPPPAAADATAGRKKRSPAKRRPPA